MKTETIFDNTRDENGNFQPGYEVSKGPKYILVYRWTNIQGDRDKSWRLTIEEWEAIDGDIPHKCMAVENSYPTHIVGEPIQ